MPIWLARIASYELAGRMQTSIPDVMDISKEPESIKRIRTGFRNRPKEGIRQELPACPSVTGAEVGATVQWSDPSEATELPIGTHSNIHKTHAMQAEIMEQPTAALISDMKRRGLLKNTGCLVRSRQDAILAGQWNRPITTGCAFTCFAGAGVKKDNTLWKE